MSSSVTRGAGSIIMLYMIPLLFILIAFVSEILLVYYSANLIKYELKRSLTISVTEGLLDEFQKDRFSTADVDTLFRNSVDAYINEKYLSGNHYEINSLKIEKVNNHYYRIEGSFKRPSFFFEKYLEGFRWRIPFNVRCKIQRLD